MKNNAGQIIQSLLTLKNGKPWLFRIKTAGQPSVTNWSTFFVSPTENYIETDNGPQPIRLIDFVDIDTHEKVRVGKLLPDKTVDNSELIKAELDRLGAAYSEIDTFIRILLS